MSRRCCCLFALLLAACAGNGDPKPAKRDGPARSTAPAKQASSGGAQPKQGAKPGAPAPKDAPKPAGLSDEDRQALEAALAEETPWKLVGLLADGADGPQADALWGECEKALSKGRLRQVEAFVAAEQIRRDAMSDFQPVRLPSPPRIEARDSDYRKAWAVKGREAATVELKKAQDKLAELRKTSDEQVAGQRERALKGGPLQVEGTSYELTGFEEETFTVKAGGEEVTYGWGTCPAALGVAVRRRAADGEDALALFRLALYALQRGEFDAAKEAFQQASAKNPALGMMVPDVDRQFRRTELFRGPVERSGGEVSVRWKFANKDSEGLEDFGPLDDGTRLGVVARQLQVKGLGQANPMARVRGAWERATIEAVVTSVAPPPAIAFESGAGRYAVAFGDETVLYALERGEDTALAKGKASARPGTRVGVALTRSGDELKVAVTVAGKACIQHAVTVSGPVRLLVGGHGAGAARFAEVLVRGALDASWEARTTALARGRLPREVKGFELSLAARSAAMASRGQLPPLFDKTSADDDVGLDGVTDKVKELLTNGRRALVQGNQVGALQAFREASELQPNLPVAAYLRGVIELRANPQTALGWLERAAAGVADFYEAQVAGAAARVRLGHLDRARAALDAAEPLRVDFQPLHVARSDLAVALGDYDQAEDSIELAYAMTPADPAVLHRSARIEALREGPGFGDGHRFTSTHFSLHTQDPKRWKPLLRRLRTLRELFEELLPVLIGPQTDARGRVVVFTDREQYHAYQGRTCEEVTDADALFDPWSNQLVAALPIVGAGWDPEAVHALQHEALHQWVHAQGVALPAWASEGLAEYAGALVVDPAGKVVKAEGKLDPQLRESLHGLIANWDARVPLANLVQELPNEFFRGAGAVKYAQAWTLVHYLLQGDDGKARAAFYRYLQLFAQVRDQPFQSQLGRAMLSLALGETFGKLKSNSVTQGWERWVAKLAKDEGLPAPGK